MTDELSTRLLSWCEAERAWLLDAVRELVRLESPSTDKAAVDRCGDALERAAAFARRRRRAHARGREGRSRHRRVRRARVRCAAGAAARSLRYRLGRGAARADAAPRGSGDAPASRSWHLRHEGRHRRGHAGDARARGAQDSHSAARHDALDDRRGNRQRHVAGRDRNRCAQPRRGAGARAVASRWRREDEPQGRRRIRAARARHLGSRRTRSGQGRERHPRARASDRRDRVGAGSATRRHRSTLDASPEEAGRTSSRTKRTRRSTCASSRWRTRRRWPRS